MPSVRAQRTHHARLLFLSRSPTTSSAVQGTFALAAHTLTPHPPRLHGSAARSAQGLDTCGARELASHARPGPLREAHARCPLSSAGVADACGTARIRETPLHHQAPPPLPHTRVAESSRLSLPPSKAHPQLLKPGLFPSRSWRPVKDEPEGAAGMHMRKGKTRHQRGGGAGAPLLLLAWDGKSGSAFPSDASLLDCKAKVIVVPRKQSFCEN